MTILTKNFRIGIGLETTAGTEQATRTSIIGSVDSMDVSIAKETRTDLTHDHLPARGFVAGHQGTITISVPLYIAIAARADASDAAIVQPYAPLFQACGLNDAGNR